MPGLPADHRLNAVDAGPLAAKDWGLRRTCVGSIERLLAGDKVRWYQQPEEESARP
jgi:hypothetical protein